MSFLNDYSKSGISRFHMPGHKGAVLHGLEPLDITEIKNADYLYESEGIIKQSEQLTADLYGTAKTLYSTEGSSLSIKTMLAIAAQNRKNPHRPMKIAAARNCHKAFLNGCILLDIQPVWIYPSKPSPSVCSCEITAEDVSAVLAENPDCEAVYITSPDYLGSLADIEGIAKVCHSLGKYLLVDNAHGAYLKFTGEKLHPIELGADMCADSAHKTLPVYTGGGYLHISKNAPKAFADCAKQAMSLFGSTSPSYLTMGSLDCCCGQLQTDLPQKIKDCCARVAAAKERLRSCGWNVGNGEPMKITVFPNSCGWTGGELAEVMRSYDIECEYSDHTAIVFMPSPCNSEEDFTRLENAFAKIPHKRIRVDFPAQALPKAVCAVSPRQAAFSPCEEIPTDKAEGRICAREAVSCQPSIPIAAPGELLTAETIKILKRYSIFSVNVIK